MDYLSEPSIIIKGTRRSPSQKSVERCDAALFDHESECSSSEHPWAQSKFYPP